MKVKNYILLSLILLLCSKVYTQKIEREYSLKEDEVPQKALDFTDNCFFECHPKWYMEESQHGKTIEAKLIYNKHRYSIEFDTLGNLLDVEKEVEFKHLDKDKQKQLNASLDSVFTKFKVKKTQKQYVGEKDVVKNVLTKENMAKNDYTLNYELVVKAKKEGSSKAYYEVLLSREGKVIRVDKIVQRSTDNFEF